MAHTLCGAAITDRVHAPLRNSSCVEIDWFELGINFPYHTVTTSTGNSLAVVHETLLYQTYEYSDLLSA